jgi:ubiquinone/menaquinone biosynthesis C-methylase UbiE
MVVQETIDEKNQFVSPAKILKELHVKEGDRVIDYGAGPGHWSIPAAKIVGKSGTVLAIDNNICILEILKSKAEIQKLTNIEIEEINLEKEKTQSKEKADLIIIANILHLIRNKEKLLERAYDLLTEKGKILVLDWHSSKKMFGPVSKIRLNEEDVITLCEEVGLSLVCSVDAGWHHFGLVFKKKGK